MKKYVLQSIKFIFCVLLLVVLSTYDVSAQVIADDNSVDIGTVSTFSGGNTTNTISNFTLPAGGDRLLLVTAHQKFSYVDGITFDGQALTMAVFGEYVQFGNIHATEIWYLSLGTGPDIIGDIVISYTDPGAAGTMRAGAHTYQNVDQSTPIGSTGIGGGGAVANSTVTLSTSANNMGVDAIISSSSNLTVGAGQTVNYQIGGGASSYELSTGSSLLLQYSASSAVILKSAAVELVQCTSCTPLAAAIPTMGEWALLIFALILLSISTIFVMRWQLILQPKFSNNQ